MSQMRTLELKCVLVSANSMTPEVFPSIKESIRVSEKDPEWRASILLDCLTTSSATWRFSCVQRLVSRLTATVLNVLPEEYACPNWVCGHGTTPRELENTDVLQVGGRTKSKFPKSLLDPPHDSLVPGMRQAHPNHQLAVPTCPTCPTCRSVQMRGPHSRGIKPPNSIRHCRYKSKGYREHLVVTSRATLRTGIAGKKGEGRDRKSNNPLRRCPIAIPVRCNASGRVVSTENALACVFCWQCSMYRYAPEGALSQGRWRSSNPSHISLFFFSSLRFASSPFFISVPHAALLSHVMSRQLVAATCRGNLSWQLVAATCCIGVTLAR